MSRAILNRSISAAAAVAIFAALLSPANATDRQDAAAVYPDVSIRAAMDRAPIVLISHFPWLAPVGHRQPRQADVPRHEAVSTWEASNSRWTRSWTAS